MRIRWLSGAMVLAIHDDAVRMGGGTIGTHSAPLLDSALNRPRFKHRYDRVREITRLAAAYAYGVIKDHPFVDGNKRTGWLTARAFVDRNVLISTQRTTTSSRPWLTWRPAC